MGQTQAKALDLRSQRRRRVVGFMPGVLYSADRQHKIVCRPFDVSPSGIGIVTDEALDDLGDDFVLVVGEKEVALRRTHSMKNFGLQTGFRHGFKVVDEDINMEFLFMRSGFL